MKIYIVVSGEYSDMGISAVFLDKEKAMNYCAAQNDAKYETYYFGNYRIWELDTKDDDINGNIEYGYLYCLTYDDSDKRDEIDVGIRSKQFYEKNCKDEFFDEKSDVYGTVTKYKVYCWLKAEDKLLASRICQDKLAALKALRKGL